MSEEKSGFWGLSLDGDAFALMKNSFNRMLTNMLKTMQSKEVEEGSITLKLDVTLASEIVPIDAEGKKTRTATKPVFEHKIVVNVPLKGEAKGEAGGEGYELIYDPETKEYVMKKITGPQLDFLDKLEEDKEEPILAPDNSRKPLLIEASIAEAVEDADLDKLETVVSDMVAKARKGDSL
jgi:hypothetical protein